MGTENIWLITIDFFLVFISAFLYMAGGTQGFLGKWLRRFLGSFVIAGALNVTALVVHAWHWQYLVVYPCIMGAYTLPYGSDIPWQKTMQRSLYALGVITSSVFCLWATGFTLFGGCIIAWSVILGGLTVFLGIKNPYSNAPLEQGLISIFLTIFIPFWPFIR